MKQVDDNMPVLVGCGDVTDMDTPFEKGRSPYDLIAQASRLALDDTGAGRIGEAIDTLAMIRLFSDTSHRFATKLGASTNAPKSIANRLGLNPGRLIYSWNGGNMPQYLLNMFAEAITRGEMKGALLCGGEALRTQYGAERANLPVSWAEDPGGTPEAFAEKWLAHGVKLVVFTRSW